MKHSPIHILKHKLAYLFLDTEISLYLAFTNELNVAQREKNIDE
jgi:hypothetical protein